MKWLIYSGVLGIVEIVVIAKLHEYFRVTSLISLYLITTLIGAFFLLIKLPELRKSLKFTKKLEKANIRKFRDPAYTPSREEIEYLRPLLFLAIYFIAGIHIVIPGIVSDIIGIVLALPFISNYYIQYKIRQAIERTDKQMGN